MPVTIGVQVYKVFDLGFIPGHRLLNNKHFNVHNNINNQFDLQALHHARVHWTTNV